MWFAEASYLDVGFCDVKFGVINNDGTEVTVGANKDVDEDVAERVKQDRISEVNDVDEKKSGAE